MHCVLCGNSAVGKSTLLEQLVRRQPGLAEPTIGVAFMRYRTPAVSQISSCPAVPESEARHLVERLGLGGYWETSGMTGQGVEAPFDYLLKHARPLDENRAGMELVGVHDKPAWRSNCCQS